MTRSLLLARGVELPPPGSLKDKMLRRGLALEQEQKVVFFEGLALLMSAFMGTKDSKKSVEKISEFMRQALSLEMFTEEFRKRREATEMSEKSLLQKLQRLGKSNG